MDNKPRWAVSVLAQRPGQVSSTALVVTARSQRDAETLAAGEAFTRWPARFGWIDHQAAAVQIPDRKPTEAPPASNKPHKTWRQIALLVVNHLLLLAWGFSTAYALAASEVRFMDQFSPAPWLATGIAVVVMAVQVPVQYYGAVHLFGLDKS